MTSTPSPAPLLSLEKWQGLGNDFVLVRATDVPQEPVAWVKWLCDRRFGVGADGVLVVDDAASPPTMVIYNADGSRPEMCGNGLRCVAAHLMIRQGEDRSRPWTVVVRTDAGDRKCVVFPCDSGFEVEVDMGRGVVLGSMHEEGMDFLTVDMGNPHAVTFHPVDQATVDRVGPRVSILPPHGYNVEFCEVEGAGGIAVTVWERGVGRTLACGTGACAVAVAACTTDRARWGTPIAVRLPGGVLRCEVEQASGQVRMRGAARWVFRAEVRVW